MTTPALKIGLLALVVASIVVAAWNHGYKRGGEDEAARFQITLDANVYYAHRDALNALEIGRAFAVSHELKALEARYQLLPDPDASSAADYSFIENNHIKPINKNHSESVARYTKLLESLGETTSTSQDQKIKPNKADMATPRKPSD